MKNRKYLMVSVSCLLSLLFLSVNRTSAQQKCNVDVIVAYTEEASRQAGSDSLMVVQINRAVVQMNQAYVNSGIHHWMRLVRTVKVNYQESGCFVTDLNAFWQGSDNSLALVHWLRGQYHADLAALLITNEQFCGLPVSDSSVAGFSSAYCAIQYKCMVENFSLAHMLGHLYGCGHTRFALDPPGNGVAFPNGHGYSWSFSEDENSASFRTIMGVGDDQNCSGQGQYDCNLINHFSNPAISYRNIPTGNEYANNAKVINDQAPLLAGFYQLPASFVVTDTVYTADLAMCMALDTLSTGRNYSGKDSATIYFRAGKQIVLNPGFSMSEGTKFETFIDPSLSNCNQTSLKKKD